MVEIQAASPQVHTTLSTGGDSGRQQQQLRRSRGDERRGFWGLWSAGEGWGLSPRSPVTLEQRDALPGCRRGKKSRARPLGAETTDFGVFQGRRRLGVGCPAGGGLSHCETWLLFLRVPAAGGARARRRRKNVSNGFPEQGHPRAARPSALGHHNFGLPGARNSSRRLPQEGLRSPSKALQPQASSLRVTGKRGSRCPAPSHPKPLDFHQAPFTPSVWPGKRSKTQNFMSMSQGSPKALSTSCDKTKHASFETYSSSIWCRETMTKSTLKTLPGRCSLSKPSTPQAEDGAGLEQPQQGTKSLISNDFISNLELG